MNLRTISTLPALLVAASAITAEAAHAVEAKPVKMGYFLFCAENPAYCTDTSGMAPDLATLDRVNRAVNHATTYTPDQPFTMQTAAGPTLVLDHWTIGASSGDCEDYAATKLDHLLAGGIARSSLRFAMGYENHEAHAVLLATIGDRVYVLDSLGDDVTPLAQSSFHLVMQETMMPDGHFGLKVTK